MTWAMCLNCGDIKFGAFVPCPRCQSASTGNAGLDVAFSDHRISKESLEQLCSIMRAIRQSSDDDELCFWTFIHYVATYHPSVLEVELKDEIRPRVESMLKELNLPVISLQMV
jgi:hypothetical protein